MMKFQICSSVKINKENMPGISKREGIKVKLGLTQLLTLLQTN